MPRKPRAPKARHSSTQAGRSGSTGTARHAGTPQTWVACLIESLRRDGCRALADFLVRQRWFGGKGRPLLGVHLLDCAPLPGQAPPTLLAVIGVEYGDTVKETYSVPIVLRPHAGLGQDTPEDPSLILLFDTPDGPVSAGDAMRDSSVCLSLVERVRRRSRWHGTRGSFTCGHTDAGHVLLAVPVREAHLITAEQSNTSVVYDNRLILKLIRKLESGLTPDFEVLEFLTSRTSFRHVPLLVGHIEYDGAIGSDWSSRRTATVGVLQSFVSNQGDGWSYALRQLGALLDHVPGNSPAGTIAEPHAHVRRAMEPVLHAMRRLGQITAELHLALASDTTHPVFRPEPITQQDLAQWREVMASQIRHVMHELRTAPEGIRAAVGLTADDITVLETGCLRKLESLAVLVDAPAEKIRHHGDYHLGQVLKTETGFAILDFEGEPARPLPERREKGCALKDVAGMLRSLNYAANAALKNAASLSEPARKLAQGWEELASQSFLDGYFDAARPGVAGFLPPSRGQAMQIVQVYQLDKAVYELRYELRNRPGWLSIPLAGLRALLQEGPR